MEGMIARRAIVDFRIGTTRMTMFPLAEEATTMMVTTMMMVTLTMTTSNRNTVRGLNRSSSSYHNGTPFATPTPGSRIPTGPRRRGFRRGGFASAAEGHTLPVGAGPGRHYRCARAVYKDGMVVCCPIRARKYYRGVESQGYQLCTLQLPPEFGKWRPIRGVLCCQNVPKVSVPTVK